MQVAGCMHDLLGPLEGAPRREHVTKDRLGRFSGRRRRRRRRGEGRGRRRGGEGGVGGEGRGGRGRRRGGEGGV